MTPAMRYDGFGRQPSEYAWRIQSMRQGSKESSRDIFRYLKGMGCVSAMTGQYVVKDIQILDDSYHFIDRR